MASDIRVRGSKQPDVTKAALYAALRGVASADISAASPVSSGIREGAVRTSGDGFVFVVEGHDGEWSEESQAAILDALDSVPGVAVETVEGGHEPAVDDDDTADAEADSDDDPAVSTIPGVGPGRAKTLREAGIETVSAVRTAGVSGLVDAGIPEGVASNILAEVD